MSILDIKDFTKKDNFENDTLNEFDLQRGSNYPIIPRDSKNYSDIGFVLIDHGTLNGTHWIPFFRKR